MADNQGISAAEIQRALRDLEYPATKEELIVKARENNADNAVLDAIEMLPIQEFGGPQDVMKAYGNE
jgi:hypothetical protein